jgi:hypothetical protein
MLSCYCQKKLAGEYKGNFAQKGYIVEELSLHCDSTFTFIRSGDKQAFKVKGTWAFINSHIMLTADTSLGKPSSLFCGRLQAICKGHT